MRALGNSAQADGRGEVTLAGDGCGQQATEALVSGEVKEEQGITCFEMEFERVCAEFGACECIRLPTTHRTIRVLRLVTGPLLYLHAT